ncbi:MAG: restriction endonuclease subunit S, partial [Bacteroidales bacterium]|nr:restriction endonuclease subunit S [Bacteroidales bacterium]
RYVMLFLKTALLQQKVKYAYGYKFNESRMQKQVILLPATAKGTPDWQYMEAFMRQKEQQILKPTIDRLCKQLIYNQIGGGQRNLLNHKWKAFDFTDVFTDIQRGKRLKKADHSEGNTPYVSSTSQTNGVDGFIGNTSRVRTFEDCLTVANSGSVGSAFYHRYRFVASDHVTSLQHEGLDKYAYLFMVPIINRLSEKYSFNREINDERIKREKILLPTDNKGEIDFAFMSAFMRDVEQDMLGTTLKYFADKQAVTPPQKQLTYRDFLLRDLFSILEPGKSKGLNHLQRHEQGISYLGATNLNNGVLDFVEPVSSMVQRGNCIAFIRNGEGSMGYAVYKAEDFIATSDMTIGYNPHLNKYTGTYITTIADRIRGKYNFGYKRNAQRLAKEIITLPATPDGNPDWDCMEAYMRHLESQKILAYLHYLQKKAS